MFHGSLNILWPEKLSNAELYIIGFLIPFTILPMIQSHFKYISSTPVKLVGLSLFYLPDTKWIKPSVSPNGPECDWIKPNMV